MYFVKINAEKCGFPVQKTATAAPVLPITPQKMNIKIYEFIADKENN
jgi:hypothetical protein